MVALARNVTVDGTTYAAGTDHTSMPARHVDRIRNTSAWVGGTAPAVSYSVAGKPRISFYDLDTAEEARAALGLGSAALLDSSAVSGKLSRTSRAQHAPALGLYFPEAEGAVANGTTDDSAAIIAAENAARLAGGCLQMQGSYAISTQIKIRCDADMRLATLNWLGGAGSGTALVIGETTGGPGDGTLVPGAVWEKRIYGPKLLAVAKTVNGWAQVSGTVGVRISNIYKSYISLVEVRNFETGLKLGGSDNKGVSYNEIHGGHLYNNKVNELHDADYASGGWVTENQIYSMRYSHNSGEGALTSGTRHIVLAAQANGYEINNTTWYSPSLESPGVVELAVEIQSKGASALVEAQDNRWIQPRLEFSGGQPRIQQGGRGNFFDGGKNIPYVIWTYTSGYTMGAWRGAGVSYQPAFSGNGGLILENIDGNSFGALTVLRPGGMAASDAAATAYVGKLSADGFRWKRYTDTEARLYADAVNGRFYVGPGATTAPTAYVGAYGAGSLTLVGTVTNIAGQLDHDGTHVGFYGATPVTRPAANPDTSGATLAALETEVNELKALLRSVGLMTP